MLHLCQGFWRIHSTYDIWKTHPVLVEDYLGLQRGLQLRLRMLFPWKASSTWPGWTTQGRHFNFSMSHYRLPGVYYKAGIHLNCDTTPTGSSPAPLQPPCLMTKVSALIPWQMCFQTTPTGKNWSWEGPAGHWGDSSSFAPCPFSNTEQTWHGQVICLLWSVAAKLFSCCARKEYQRGHILIKYLQLQ